MNQTTLITIGLNLILICWIDNKDKINLHKKVS